MQMCLTESQGGGGCFRPLGNVHIKFKYLARERDEREGRRDACIKEILCGLFCLKLKLL